MRTTVLLKRTIVLICTYFIFSQATTHAQAITTGNGKFEIGLGFGPMFFLGDLGGGAGKGGSFIKDVNLPLTKLSKGAYLEAFPAEWLGFRLSLNHSMVDGYDSIIKSMGGAEESRKARNLSFRSSIFEAYTAAEIYPTVPFERYEGLQGKFRPYGVVGVGLLHFNPQAIYNTPNGRGSWINLQPLHLEGQGMAEYPDRKNYKLTTIEVPVGIGAKYYLKDNFYLDLEFLYRRTFTDYIDDVSTTYIDGSLFDKYLAPQQAAMARQLYDRRSSNGQLTRPILDEQRGNPKNNDTFFSTVLRFGWRLNDNNTPSARAARQMRCPSY